MFFTLSQPCQLGANAATLPSMVGKNDKIYCLDGFFYYAASMWFWST